MHRWKLYAKEMLCVCTIMLELTDLVQLLGEVKTREKDDEASESHKAAEVCRPHTPGTF